MQQIFTAIFYQPLVNLLIFIYNAIPTHDMGIAIIVLTVLVKALLFPLSWKQLESQKLLQDIQPKLNELKEQYKDDKQAFAQAQMKYFQEQKINPLASCLPLLFQLPFLFALFYVFSNGLKNQDFSHLLYPFVHNPGVLNETLFGLFSLTQHNIIVLALITALAQFFQSKMMLTKRPPSVPGAKDEEMAVAMNRQMMYFMPIITGVMTYRFPGGLGLYWLVQSLLAIVQQYVFNMMVKKTGAVEVISAK